MLKDKREFIRVRHDAEHCSVCCPGHRVGKNRVYCMIYDTELQMDHTVSEYFVAEDCKNSKKASQRR